MEISHTPGQAEPRTHRSSDTSASAVASRLSVRESRYEEAIAEETLALTLPHGVRVEDYRLAKRGGAMRSLTHADGSEERCSDATLPWSLVTPSARSFDAARREKLSTLFRQCTAAAGPDMHDLSIVALARERRFRATMGAEGDSGRDALWQLQLRWIEGGEPLAPLRSHRWVFANGPAFDEGVHGAFGPLELLRGQRRGLRRWPCPKGTIAVYWARPAVAALLAPLLEAFEGDRHLPGSTPRDIPLGVVPFDCIDEPLPEISPVDQEGTRRRAVPFVAGGKFIAVAASRSVAQELRVDRTGHARRGDFRDIRCRSVPWRVAVRPREAVPELLTQAGDGLYVHDVVVTPLDPPGPIPLSPRVRLDARGVRLLHGGVPGEAVEPFRWEGSYGELLRLLRLFDSRPGSIYRTVSVQGTDVVSELMVGEALSPGFPVAGQVPREHYW